ncbi:DUF2309 family protein [Microvirga tunisiensis]|uniref:Probable inorganic carbon transporter subunit DabA n=1 Tax=Pannonibacter tanglangensis TaxID=2750084 RepID=A0A7X5F4G0_9HYPH|nr:DUF2309 domain-containing protein [Pannonibacter sp. XCT-53]NBN79586.1 DUF2309 family protein [Pannonibacter sp. XCT-53]
MTLHTLPAEAEALGSAVPLLGLADVAGAAQAAIRQIPPAFPLAATVAVNPFLGQSGLTLAETAALLGRLGGIPVLRPRTELAAEVASGRIEDCHLAAALAASPHPLPLDLAGLKAALRRPHVARTPLASVAALAGTAEGRDWVGLIDERVGAFAAALFDEGQALWPLARAGSVYATWRLVASHDLTTGIAGLTGFAAQVANAPDTSLGLILRAVTRMGVPGPALASWFHQLLLSLGGWGQAARYRLWQAELEGGSDDTLLDLLAIRLAHEEALFLRLQPEQVAQWQDIVASHATPALPSEDEVIDAVVQEAAERAAQARLAARIGPVLPRVGAVRPALQAAFCIDVRSEVFRRALESQDTSIQTLGFAGFFGIGAAHRRFASDVVEKRLPVLLTPGVFSCSGTPAQSDKDQDTRIRSRAGRAWRRFRQAAVSSFAFVEAAGPLYAAKIARDSLRLADVETEEPAPCFNPPLPLADRLAAAAKILRAMSLTGPFARVVLLTGHGATAANNPHLSALQCGACGGHSGEVNARLLVSLLNDLDVRKGLVAEGISIPLDTLFVAGLHDTTTDTVTLYDKDVAFAGHVADLARLRGWLDAAGRIARAERAPRLPGATDGASVVARSRNWAEVRPEWGLAGCEAFIAAPRERTQAHALSGRVFLHDYVWQKDEGFQVLELILTAPVVVASWISLQYYGSSVAPGVYGGGNKLLHNVTGGMGVVEGNGGALRVGLPLQSVHDGVALRHEPLRLTVVVDAPREAINDILARHDGVRSLFDKGWLHLVLVGETGGLSERYAGDLRWVTVD